MKLILASGSPRRRQMLTDLGLHFKTWPAHIDESCGPGESPQNYVKRISKEKALAVIGKRSLAGVSGWAVLSADTIVVLGKKILGKPKNSKDAVRMLANLSGKTHQVFTAYSWIGMASKEHRRKKFVAVTSLVRTKVTFEEKPLSFWRWYVATGEPMDKAGAYAAQGKGVAFIQKVSGSYSNVVGLPLAQVMNSYLKLFGGDLREHFGKSR